MEELEKKYLENTIKVINKKIEKAHNFFAPVAN